MENENIWILGGVPCQPPSSLDVSTVPSNGQGRVPCWWKRNGKGNLIAPPVFFHAGCQWL